MAQEGSARCLARRARVVGALLASTASLAAAGPAKASRRKLTGYVMDDSSIRTAVAAWFDDRSGAEATYGHISTWATGGVTDMSYLFCAQYCSYSNSGAAFFNEDISAWDTSGVTTMEGMFYKASAFNGNIRAWDTSGVTNMQQMFQEASAFNRNIGSWSVANVYAMGNMFIYATAFDQDLSDWRLDSVTDISGMFFSASSFDQDLDWCLDDDVTWSMAFEFTQCWSTSVIGRSQASRTCPGCSSSPRPSTRTSAGAWMTT